MPIIWLRWCNKTVPTVQQLNVRLDAKVKQSAEEVLNFVGSSATEVVRALYAKIAGGAADYAEAMAVLCPNNKTDATDASLVSEGWKIADEFYRSIGCDSTAMPIEDRAWDDVYADAMNEHFCEKGILGNAFPHRLDKGLLQGVIALDLVVQFLQ